MIMVMLRLGTSIFKSDIMKKLNICMLSSDFLPNIGGIAAHVYELSNSLSEKGHHVSVITLRKNFNENKHEKIGDIDIYRIFYPQIPIIGYFIHLFLVWLEIKFSNGFDLIHVHTINHAPVLKLLKSKSVETEHSSGVLEDLENNKNIKLYKTLFSSNEHLIAPSDEIVQKLIELGFEPEIVSFISNGVDIHEFNPSIDGSKILSIKESFNISSEKIVLCPRRLVPKNGVNYFIESIPDIITNYGANVKFLIVGNSNSEAMAILKRRSSELNLDDQLIFVGSVPNNQMPFFYVLSDVVVLPSLKEATSIAGLEAMSMGKPLVGTNVGGIPQIIKNRETGILVPPKEPKKMAEAIIFLLNERDERILMGKKARQRVEERFSWDIIAEETLKIYEKVLKKD